MRYVKNLMIAGIVLMFLSAGPAIASRTRSVAASSTWTVEKSTELNSLTVSEGATVSAGKGHSLTMAVDGVQRDIEPGTYQARGISGDTSAGYYLFPKRRYPGPSSDDAPGGRSGFRSATSGPES